MNSNTKELPCRYDSKGNVTDHYIEDKDIGTGIVSAYQYDNEGRVLTVIIGSIKNADERKSFKNRYDHLGRLTERIDNMNQKQYYEYDAIGNMTKFTDRNGNTISCEYDGLNRALKPLSKTRRSPKCRIQIIEVNIFLSINNKNILTNRKICVMLPL